jgi:transposase
LEVNVRLRDVLACLDDLEEFVWEAYRHNGAGRPPRNPLGILKALVVKRFRNVPSDRQLYRRLWSDPELRELCDIEEHEKPYHPSQMSRFRQRLGPERLECLMEAIVGRLRDAGAVKGEVLVCDATFIQAYSKRDPKDDSKGYSDPDARVGRAEKTYRLGYKFHLAFDAHSELPLAVIAASANENEKKHAPKLIEKTAKATNGQTKVLVADSQYSSKKLRRHIYSHGMKPVIPYPSNQKPAEAEFIHVDKRFKIHGPERLKTLYAHKASAERAISRLKQHLSLENHKVRGLRNILIHALLCIIAMLFVALTAIKHGKPEQIRAITRLT